MSPVFIAFLVEGILCAILGVRNASASQCEYVSLGLMAVNVIVALLYIHKRYQEYEGKIFPFIALSLLLKCLLIIWDYYGTDIFILPNSHSDSESFHREAIYFMNYGRDVVNYPYVVGWIYSFFGVQRITAQYFNVILSLLGIDILERILCMSGISKSSREKTLILAALLPNYLIMSAILIRECLISVILCISLYLFMQWWKNNNALALVLAIGFSLLGCWFHSGCIAMTMGFALVMMLTRRNADGIRELNMGFRSIFLAVLFMIVFSYLFDALSNSLLRRFGGMEMEHIETYIDEHHLYDASASKSSNFSAGIPRFTGITGILINSPIRLFYFLWVPMPWMFRGVGDIIAFFGSSLFYGGTAIGALYLTCKKSVTGKALLVAILLIAISGALIFSWGIDSAGSALRHREKFYFIYLFLFALITNANKTILSQSSK